MADEEIRIPEKVFRDCLRREMAYSRSGKSSTADRVRQWLPAIAKARAGGAPWAKIESALYDAGLRTPKGWRVTASQLRVYWGRYGGDSQRIEAEEAKTRAERAEAAAEEAMRAATQYQAETDWVRDLTAAREKTLTTERDQARAEVEALKGQLEGARAAALQAELKARDWERKAAIAAQAAAERGKERDLAAAGRDQALEAQKALEGRLATTERDRDRTRAEAAQAIRERQQAQAEQQQAQEAQESRLKTLEGERDKARAEAAQEAQERIAGEAGRKEAMEAQKALTERLETLENRLEAEQTKTLLLDGRVIALDKQKNLYQFDGLTNDQMNAVGRHWNLLKDIAAKQSTEQQQILEESLEVAARHAGGGDILLRIQLCVVASDAETDTVKGLQARNILADKPALQAACARFHSPKQPQPPTHPRSSQRP